MVREVITPSVSQEQLEVDAAQNPLAAFSLGYHIAARGGLETPNIHDHISRDAGVQLQLGFQFGTIAYLKERGITFPSDQVDQLPSDEWEIRHFRTGLEFDPGVAEQMAAIGDDELADLLRHEPGCLKQLGERKAVTAEKRKAELDLFRLGVRIAQEQNAQAK